MFEDVTSQEATKRFTLDSALVQPTQDKHQFNITDRKLKGIQFENWKYIEVKLTPLKSSRGFSHRSGGCQKFYCITEANDGEVQINVNQDKFDEQILHFRYRVEFKPNRFSFRACQDAICELKCSSLENFFTSFERSKNLVCKKIRNLKKTPFHVFEWFNKSIGTNREQRLAVKNVVNCTAYPLPFIIFGPPGGIFKSKMI